MIRVLMRRLGLLGRGLEPLQLGEHVVGRDHVGIELDLERGVGRADLGDALDLRVADGVGHRQALEEGLERHLLVDLDEDVLVAAEGISVLHRCRSRLPSLEPSRPLRLEPALEPAVWNARRRARLRRRRAPGAAARGRSTPPTSSSRERALQAARCACGAILAPDDQLAEQRIVEGRDRVAGIEHGVEADARPARHAQVADRARERHEAVRRILGVDAHLDGVAAERDVRPGGGAAARRRRCAASRARDRRR